MTADMLCAGGVEGKDQCKAGFPSLIYLFTYQGDSGGPLTVNVNGSQYLVGVVSHSQCGQVDKLGSHDHIHDIQGNFHGVYSEVSAFKVWIHNTINNFGGTPICPLYEGM